MVKVREDLTGQVFGRLTVVSQTEDYVNPNTGRRAAQWNCICSCKDHKMIQVRGHSLKSGNTISCGCLQRERTSRAKKKENSFDLNSQEYAIGYTLKGEPFWFDKEDYDLVRKYCWHYDSGGYVVHKDDNGNIYLHRLVMGVTDDNIQVDHISHPPKPNHKVDNRKVNLRLVTNQQNQMNNAIGKNNTSGKTGVSWDKARMKWEAYIFVNAKKIHLGRFIKKEDAINARKEAELKYFKEYRYNDYN